MNQTENWEKIYDDHWLSPKTIFPMVDCLYSWLKYLNPKIDFNILLKQNDWCVETKILFLQFLSISVNTIWNRPPRLFPTHFWWYSSIFFKYKWKLHPGFFGNILMCNFQFTFFNKLKFNLMQRLSWNIPLTPI